MRNLEGGPEGMLADSGCTDAAIAELRAELETEIRANCAEIRRLRRELEMLSATARQLYAAGVRAGMRQAADEVPVPVAAPAARLLRPGVRLHSVPCAGA